MDRISQEDFFHLSAEEIEARTGLSRTDHEDMDSYREKAWESYKVDIANRDEWGGTEGESIPQDE